MIPNKSGYYWIKSLGYDGTGGKSISDWYPSYYVAKAWEIMGSECGLNADDVVEIGPEIVEPDIACPSIKFEPWIKEE